MNCTICGQPVVLIPSAEERAAKGGGTAEHYRRLFPRHSECELKKRAEDTSELMRRRREMDTGMSLAEVYKREHSWPAWHPIDFPPVPVR